MSSITIKTTAQTPSRIGMPIYGSALRATCATGTTLGTVVRDRSAAGVDVVKGAFPGTSAWRPPTC